MRVVSLILLGLLFWSCQQPGGELDEPVFLQTVGGDDARANEVLEKRSLLVYVDLSLDGSCLCNQALVTQMANLASLYPDVAVYSVIVSSERDKPRFSNDKIPLDFLQEFGPVYQDKTGYARERYSFFNGSGFLFLDRYGDVVMALPMEVDEVADIMIHKTLSLL